MLHEPGSGRDAGEDALGGGIAVAFDDHASYPAEEGAGIIGIMQMLAQPGEGRLERDVFLLCRSFELFEDDHADALSGLEENIACKAISDKDIDPSLEDLA